MKGLSCTRDCKEFHIFRLKDEGKVLNDFTEPCKLTALKMTSLEKDELFQGFVGREGDEG